MEELKKPKCPFEINWPLPTLHSQPLAIQEVSAADMAHMKAKNFTVRIKIGESFFKWRIPNYPFDLCTKNVGALKNKQIINWS